MGKDSLKQLPLFASLNFDTIERLTEDLPRQNFKKDELIIRQGEKNLQAYLLVEGKVGVYAESHEGVKSTLVFHEAPCVLGEIEIWQERPYLGSVIAIEPCTTLVLNKNRYLKLLHSNHQVCVNMVQLLSNQLYRDATQTRMRLFGRVEHLVAGTLCSFAQLYGEEHRYGILIRKEINKSEIAEILGVARRSVIRAFETLEEEKLVQLEKKQLVIPDIVALRRKANAPFP